MITDTVALKILSLFCYGYGVRRIVKDLGIPGGDIRMVLLQHKKTPHPDTPGLAYDSWDINPEE